MKQEEQEEGIVTQCFLRRLFHRWSLIMTGVMRGIIVRMRGVSTYLN